MVYITGKAVSSLAAWGFLSDLSDSIPFSSEDGVLMGTGDPLQASGLGHDGIQLGVGVEDVDRSRMLGQGFS